MRIRIFADIELPDFDTEAPEGPPKSWNWHHILNLGPQEQVWIYGAEKQELEISTPKHEGGTIRTW